MQGPVGVSVRLVADVIRVLLALPAIEKDRLRLSPQKAAHAARQRAALRPERNARDRARLRRAIAIVDSCLPVTANCLRRSLLEMSLDVGASRERLLAGFRSGGGAGSGHAWLESSPPSDGYDAVLTM